MRTNRPIPKNVKAVIADIIMAGSQIEHLVTSALINLSKIDAFTGLIIFNKIQINQRLQKLQYLVEATKPREFAEKYDEISASIGKFYVCRNTVAHGCYAFTETYEDKQDDYYFSDISSYGMEGELFGTRFGIYNRLDLEVVASNGLIIASQLRALFAVKMIHEVPPDIVRDSKPPTPRSLRKSESAKPPPPRRPPHA